MSNYLITLITLKNGESENVSCLGDNEAIDYAINNFPNEYSKIQEVNSENIVIRTIRG